MKHTSIKQEFLVIGRATIESYPIKDTKTKNYRKHNEGNNYTFKSHKRNLIRNETYQK